VYAHFEDSSSAQAPAVHPDIVRILHDAPD